MRKERLEIYEPLAVWRLRVLESGLDEIPVSGDIAILATQLEDFHSDPADRIITATAIVTGHILLTANERILTWKGVLSRQDARQ